MYIGVDLGSTNIKAAVYDEAFRLIDRRSVPVTYLRENGFVEFDAEAYCEGLLTLLAELIADNGITSLRQLAFTGQAESLVVLGEDGRPLINAISWMDERSTAECRELERSLSPETYRAVTGQQAILPTWPATKILWLRRNRPEIHEAAATYMMLKDYVVYRLTGVMLADMSIATFTFYFDIVRKCYWKELLDILGVPLSKLPPPAEPCTVAGPLRPDVAVRLGLAGGARVNIGTLDHFAGMIGTGNTQPGRVTLSVGTVMALAVLSETGTAVTPGVALHYGFQPDSYVLLPVAESGGASLEWFRETCMPQLSFRELDEVIAARPATRELLFLPYLVGTSAPEFDADACGVFWGLRQSHDACDMAAAVMEGVAFVLRKNCDALREQSIRPRELIVTGGGAKSPVWCRMLADATGLPVTVPREREVACLGAAMIAAMGDGRFQSLDEAVAHCVGIERRYEPEPAPDTAQRFRRFCALYEASLRVARMD